MITRASLYGYQKQFYALVSQLMTKRWNLVISSIEDEVNQIIERFSVINKEGRGWFYVSSLLNRVFLSLFHYKSYLK